MNVQINCKDNVSENDLRYIFHNLEDIKKEYEETKNDMKYKKYVNGKVRWVKELKGNWSISVDMVCISNGKTLYFKIK